MIKNRVRPLCKDGVRQIMKAGVKPFYNGEKKEPSNFGIRLKVDKGKQIRPGTIPDKFSTVCELLSCRPSHLVVQRRQRYYLPQVLQR